MSKYLSNFQWREVILTIAIETIWEAFLQKFNRIPNKTQVKTKSDQK